MVSYIENVFKCKNKGDFKNRAVFSNNIFFLFTLALLMTLASTAESPSYAIMVSTPFRLLVRLFGLHYVCLLLRSRPSSFLETPLSFLPLKLLHLRLHLRQYSSLAQRGRRQDSVWRGFGHRPLYLQVLLYLLHLLIRGCHRRFYSLHTRLHPSGWVWFEVSPSGWCTGDHGCVDPADGSD